MRSLVIWSSLAVALVLSSCARTQSPWDELPAIRSAPSFVATNFDGSQLSSQQLAGKPWIGSFMFTTCTGVCPVMNDAVAQLQARYGEAVRFVSFTVDPAHDSLPALAEYARRYGARAGVWFLVRTSLDSVRMLSRDGFLLSDPVTPDRHSPRLVLVDERGVIRGYYNSLDSSDLARLRDVLDRYLQVRTVRR